MAAGISIFFRAPIRPGRSKAWPDSSKCSGEAKMDFKEATPLKGSDGKPLLIGDPLSGISKNRSSFSVERAVENLRLNPKISN